MPLSAFHRRTVLHLLAGGLAISTVCTHLGCAVFFREEEQRFECPCHQGVFDAQGEPLSGTPERPLGRYPVTVREGKIFVQLA